MKKPKRLDYKEAGVNLDAARQAVSDIAVLAKATFRQGVLGEIGHFGAFFEIEPRSYEQPVLVSSIDGVGTKIKIASALGKYRGIGHDLVNHCVNDIMCCGAEPLYFLDYLALGRLDGKAVHELASGLAEACKENNCALIGGETAEMPDLYDPGDFDIAGCITGIVEKAAIIDGRAVTEGDILLGLKSTGLHTNGFSLARRIVELSSEAGYHKYYDVLQSTIGEALLTPHRSYREAIRSIRGCAEVHGLAHITGGGIIGNTQRLLTGGLTLHVDWSSWTWPDIFGLLQELGGVQTLEMRRVFNLGIGLVLVVQRKGVESIREILAKSGEESYVIGEVVRDA